MMYLRMSAKVVSGAQRVETGGTEVDEVDIPAVAAVAAADLSLGTFGAGMAAMAEAAEATQAEPDSPGEEAVAAGTRMAGPVGTHRGVTVLRERGA